MNKVILMGRLTKDPELRTVQAQIPVCSFTLAVDRRFQKPGDEKKADFINVTAWRRNAEFVTRFFRKGQRMLVTGSLQTRSWDDPDGRRQFAMDVIADDIEFVEPRQDAGGRRDAYDQDAGGYGAPPFGGPGAPPQGPSGGSAPSGDQGFFPAPDDDTALPFDL